MKKILIALGLILLIVVGGFYYIFSGANDFIKQQIETQGSKLLGTQVSVFSVDLKITEGRLSINDIDVENPKGYSEADAFSLDSITLDLGGSTSEPYIVQEVSLNSPEILYELDASGKGNLMVLKDNLQKALPKAKQEPAQEQGTNPLMIVENVVIEAAKLRLNFENLPTGDIKIDKKAYEVTLPTFNAGSIGKPNGIPANEVGAAIAKAMLDNVIEKAKQEGKKKLQEKIDQKKDELKDKAKDKLKEVLQG